MDNFDFTQFISFDSDLPYNKIRDELLSLFGKTDFSIIEFENIENIKKEYYSDYWNRYTFELQKDDFLSDFMEWMTIKNVPKSINEFEKIINKLSKLQIKEITLIICSFAEKMKTNNEIVYTNQKNLLQELFKMSIHSFRCPDNLIVHIKD